MCVLNEVFCVWSTCTPGPPLGIVMLLFFNTITDDYPSSTFPCNPIALGTKWLAYSETKVKQYIAPDLLFICAYLHTIQMSASYSSVLWLVSVVLEAPECGWHVPHHVLLRGYHHAEECQERHLCSQ